MSALSPPPAWHTLARTPLSLLLIALAVLLTYYHSLDVPFYLDDFSSIQENPLIYDWHGWDSLRKLWESAPMRFVGSLSFVLNYQTGQFNVWGYHLLNIAIHLLNGWLVYALLASLLRTPRLQAVPPLVKTWLPLLTALLFVLHPLHIQAVTYIVQRLAALAVLFYLAALVAFIQARLSPPGKIRWRWAALCLLLALLALLTKQNTVTLPLMMLLIGGVFFGDDLVTLKRIWQLLLGGVAVLGGVWLVLALTHNYNPFSLAAMETLTRDTAQISRLDYLAVQMSVLWHYIRLFFLPFGLHIDYDPQPLTGFANLGVLLALAGHLLVLGTALYQARRWPLLAFAILFYYLAHSVESSLIPIRDVVFEHRTYLPDVGLCLLSAWLVLQGWTSAQSRLQGAPAQGTPLGLLLIVTVLLGGLATLTWQRNQLWRDPIALWQHNVQQAPNKARGWSILGKHLIQAERPQEGIAALQQAIRLQQATQGSNISTFDIINLIVGLKMLKKYDQALAITETALAQKLPPMLRSKFLINKSNVYFEQKQYAPAEQALKEAIAVYPQSITARANLASLLGSTGRYDEAEALYLEVLRLDPDSLATQQNLQTLRKMREQAQTAPAPAPAPQP